MRFKSRICWQDWKKNTENFLPQLAASSTNLLVEDFRLLQSQLGGQTRAVSMPMGLIIEESTTSNFAELH